jgi:HrpA-like RNA helicase
VAATSLAHRVAAEQNSSVGKLVGYAVRFDEKQSPTTRIKYLTDGMIVRELMSDATLSKYSVIIVDEAHERTLRTDLLIANLKSIQKHRNSPPNSKGKQSADGSNPLKIIIMSATLDAEKFSRFFEEYGSIPFLLQCLMISKCKNPLHKRPSTSRENILLR